MEYIAIRENLRRKEYIESLKARRAPTGLKMAELLGRQHRGQSYGAALPEEITPEFGGATKWRAAAPSSPPTSTTGSRADDHRPQFPGEDQTPISATRALAPRSRKKWKK